MENLLFLGVPILKQFTVFPAKVSLIVSGPHLEVTKLFPFKVMATNVVLVNVFLFTFNNMLLETLNKMQQVYQL